MMTILKQVMLLGLLLVGSLSWAHTPPKTAKVFFIGLSDGMTVSSPLTVKFGIEGFGITPAGTKGKRRHTAGHHHLLIDLKQLPELDEVIPRDAQHLHFDQGEMQAVLNLPKGEHTLQLLLGDESHEPQDPALFSKKIRIVVK